jgi:ADP-ribose pyrophosphatase YjhB (NUDIX family)
LNELIGCLAGIVDQSEACSSATSRQLSKEMRLDQPKGSAIAVGNHPPRTPRSKTVRLEPQFKKPQEFRPTQNPANVTLRRRPDPPATSGACAILADA